MFQANKSKQISQKANDLSEEVLRDTQKEYMPVIQFTGKIKVIQNYRMSLLLIFLIQSITYLVEEMKIHIGLRKNLIVYVLSLKTSEKVFLQE